MNLAELKVIVSDRLYMEGIYSTIKDYAVNGRSSVEYIHTVNYPNQSRSLLNVQQIKQLRADGYTVIYEGERLVVSGW